VAIVSPTHQAEIPAADSAGFLQINHSQYFHFASFSKVPQQIEILSRHYF
jgi:hypothetical protein